MGTNMLSINQIENTFFNLTARSGKKKTIAKNQANKIKTHQHCGSPYPWLMKAKASK
jgi:hypothetical protein